MKHIGAIVFTYLSFSLIAFGQVEKKPPTNLEILQSRGLDPRVSNIRPETPAAVPLFIEPERDIPTGTIPRSVRLKTQKVTLAPNVRIHPNPNGTQSEMSIHTNPTNPDIVIAGSNAADNSIIVLSQGWYYTTNGGATWLGRDTLPTHTILTTYLSDPGVGIDLDNRLFFSALNLGAPSPDVFVSRSTNDGTSWTQAFVNNPGSNEDKGHFTVDVNPGSPYENYLYSAFTDFSPVPSPIVVSRSTDHGLTFSPPTPISGGIGSDFAQGVNLAVGPGSEVYAVWSGYDGFPAPTTRVGFNVSTDGGATWGTAHAIDTIHEIRGSLTKGGNSIRVSSFPSMAVDRSNGPRRGWIYVVYPEDVTSTPDIMMIRSTDGGTSWGPAIKVNQDGGVKDQWYPWVTVDPTTGGLYVVYYDSRNFPANDSAQVYISNSLDGGDTFEDVLVSDMPFLPSPIPGLASGYMGDYIGIAALDGIVWPCWNDNRTGRHQAYTSRIQFLSVGSSATISVSPDTLNFGTFFVGLSDTLTVSVRNLGYPDTLVISSIASDSTAFTPSVGSMTIPGGNSRSMSVFFSPETTGLFTGKLWFTSNDTVHPLVSLPMRGNVVYPPVAGASPDSMYFSVNEGDSAAGTLTIFNRGLGDMQFSIKHSFASPSSSQFPRAPVPASSPGRRTSDPYASITAKELGGNISGGARSVDRALVVEPDGGRLFGAGDNKVTELNPTTGTVISSFTLPVSASNQPTALAYSGSEIFFTDAYTTSLIYVLDPDSGHVLRSFAAPSSAIDGLACVDGLLYAQDYNQSRIFELNPLNGAVLRTLTPPVTIGGGLDGGNGRLFASNFSNAIYELSLVDASVIRSFVPFTTVYGLGFTGQHLYASVPGSGIDQYDPNTGTYLGRISNTGYAALAGGGSDWLSASPIAGIVPPSDSVHVQVKVRSDELNGGTYHGKVSIESNDPVTPVLSVQVAFRVIGAPNLVLNRDTADFGNVFVNYPDTMNLTVSNNGSDTLHVTGMSNTNSHYSIVGPSLFDLAPHQFQPVKLRFLPLGTGVETGVLSISSNDASDPTVTAVLTGNGLLPPAITVSPDSVTQTLFSGDSAHQTVTVSNTGFSNLNFSLSILGTSSLGALQEKPLKPPKIGRNPDLSPFAKDISAQNAAATGSRGGATGLAGKADMSTASADILVLATTTVTNSVVRVLDSLGKSYDLVTTNVFTGIDYSPYHTIIAAMDGGLIDSASVHALAIAAAGGKLLIMLGGTNYPSFYQGVQTYLLSHNNVQGWTTSTTPHLTVTDTNNRLALGLPATYNFNNPNASAYMLRIDDIVAPVAAKNGDNNPILVNKNMAGGGELIYFINSPTDFYWSNPSDFAIFRRILSNAIDLSGWISAAPRSGVIAAGSSLDIDVKFDASGLNGGEYRASLFFSSNDPATPGVTTPAHLHVIGAPNIGLSKDSIRYGDAYLGYPKTDSVKISNSGTDLLTVRNISSDNPRFAADADSFGVTPGASRMLHVSLTPTDTGMVAGVLTITSNDPTDSIRHIYLAGHGIYPPVIAVTPDSLGITLDEGDSTTVQLTIANHGLGELRWGGTTSSSRTTLALKYSLPERMVSFSTNRADAAGAINTFEKGRPRITDGSYSIPSMTALLSDLTGKRIGFAAQAGYSVVASDLMLRGATVVNVSFPLATGALDSLDVLSVDDAIFSASSADIARIRDWLKSGRGLVTQGDESLVALDSLLAGTGITEFPAPTFAGSIFTNIMPHPTTAGVDTINAISYLAYSTVVAPGQAIAFDDLARPNISVSSLGTGRVLASGNEVMGDYNLGVGDTRLFSNQVFDWLAASTDFIALNPTLGSVNPGDSQHVTVKITSGGLDGGTYHAYIHLNNNDPGHPDDVIPLQLRVIGKPTIVLGADTIDFGNVYVGYPDTMTLRVDNKGSDTLHVSNMTSSDPHFSVAGPVEFVVSPHGFINIGVRFLADAAAADSGALTIASDDPHTPGAVVHLLGAGLHPPIIGLTPDSLGFSVFQGDSAAANLSVTNSGLGSLSFRITVNTSGSPSANRPSPGSASRPLPASSAEKDPGPDAMAGKNLNSASQGANRAKINSIVLAQHIYIGAQMKFGISNLGEIMPFESPFGSEHLQVGAYVSGYTLAYFDGVVDRVAYTVFDASNGSFTPVSYNEIENSTTRLEVEVVVRTTDNKLELRRRITFEKFGKSVGISEQIRNISASGVTNVALKEDADWDVDGIFTDNWNYDATHNMIYAFANHYAAIAGRYNPDFATVDGWGSYTTRQTPNDRNPRSSFDGLEVLHYDIGNLSAGGQGELQFVYGVGNSLADLRTSIELGFAQVGGWLTVVPDTGSVLPGGNTNIQVKINTQNLEGGTYHARLHFNSNDPGQRDHVVPVTLTLLTVDPLLRVSAETLATSFAFGDSATLSLVVYNDGLGPLHLHSADYAAEGEIVGAPTGGIFSRGLMRGNVYRVSNGSSLEEFRTYCDIPAPTLMQFAVYEAARLAGPYHRLSSVIVSIPDTGARFRTSGLLHVPLRQGKYYFLGTASLGYATFFSSPLTSPVHLSSGDAVSSGIWAYDEDHPDITPPISSTTLWRQAVAISGTYVRSINPADATIAAGDSRKLLVNLKGAMPVGIFASPLVLTSNDKIQPSLPVSMNIKVSLQLSASAGWNLFSVPLSAEDSRKEVLFPAATSAAFSFSGKYAQVESLKFGEAFWLKYGAPELASVSGRGMGDNSVHVRHAWNLIGPPSYLVTLANVQSDPPGNLVSHFIGYSSANGYYSTDSMIPGRGFWVKATGDGDLIFNEGPGPASGSVQTMTKIAPTKKSSADGAYNTVSFTDNESRVRTVYFASSAPVEKNGWMELPPPAPSGEFDVRFASERLVEERDPTQQRQEFPIRITGAAFPLAVQWTIVGDEAGHALAITFADGSSDMLAMNKSGSAVIAKASLLEMKLVIAGDGASEIPTVFAMYQNYPNPFNPSTRFRFDLPVDSRVRLYIYNTLGQEVARIVDGVDYAAGAQTVVWNGAGRDGQALPSGVYFYKLNAAPNGGQFQPFAKTGKMLLMK